MAVEQHPAAAAPQPAPCAGPLGWREGILGIITGILGVPSLCREVDGAGSSFGKALTAFPALDPALPGKRQGMWRRDGADSTPGIAELLAQQSRCVTLVAGAESLPCQTLPAPSWILIPEGLELIFIYQRLLMRPPSDAPALRRSR